MAVSNIFDGNQTAEIETWLREQLHCMQKERAPKPEYLEIAFDALKAAIKNLQGDHPGRIDNFTQSDFAKLEAKTPFRFALDPNAFQVICKTEETQSAGLDWPRFGLSKVGNDKIEVFVSLSMYDQDIDLASKAPDVALFLNKLTDTDTSVVAFLGTARLDANEGVALVSYVREAVLWLENTAFMTGGYRGAFGHSYGVTRAGFDVPKKLNRPTLWVMCDAGVKDASQTPDAKSICGTNWGDDTPAMEASSDGAIFFRNIPAGKNYGAWTYVEIANFVASNKNKPIAIVDPIATTSHELLFGRQVPLFPSGAQAAAYLSPRLEAVRKQRTHYEVSPMTMRTLQRGREQDDIQMVDISLHVARYVPRQFTATATKALAAAGLMLPADSEEQWAFIHAIWRDLLLLDAAGFLKIKEGDSRQEILDLPSESTIAAYVRYREAVQSALNAGAPHLGITPTLKDGVGAKTWFLSDAKPIDTMLHFLRQGVVKA